MNIEYYFTPCMSSSFEQLDKIAEDLVEKSISSASLKVISEPPAPWYENVEEDQASEFNESLTEQIASEKALSNDDQGEDQ